MAITYLKIGRMTLRYSVLNAWLGNKASNTGTLMQLCVLVQGITSLLDDSKCIKVTAVAVTLLQQFVQLSTAEHRGDVMMDKHICRVLRKKTATMAALAKLAIVNAKARLSTEVGQMAICAMSTFGFILGPEKVGLILEEIPAWSNRR